ncbi:MAG: FadR family transcriptional regulator [Myxococcales bacterium]|nr:FadR family transcriptional regulator [Myxococcales bacterium]MCB9642937.1 FadR family transcriptional regulator [Myxococcales bacterium]
MSIFEPIKKAMTVPEQLAGSLRRLILGGDLSVGDPLPAEKKLAEQFETNRVSLRQALQILKADGLIEGGQGRSWRVSDFRRSGSLRLLPELFLAQGFSREVVDIIDDFMEVREPILLHVVRRVGERSTEHQRAEMRNRLIALQTLMDEGAEPERIFVADLEWFESLIDAANSLLLGFFYRPMSQIYKRSASYVAQFWSPVVCELDGEMLSYPQAFWKVQGHLESGEWQEAQEVLRAYMRADREHLREKLSSMSWMLREQDIVEPKETKRPEERSE